MRLSQHDTYHLRAATGWLELGDYTSALSELENLRPSNSLHPEVLKLRWQIYSKAKKWNYAFTLAHGLTRLLPDEPEMFIWRSQAARQMEGGGLIRAFELLLDAANKFPDEPSIRLHLACYCYALKRIPETKRWLRIMFEIAERKGTASHWSRHAFLAEDLKPLWAEVGRTEGVQVPCT